MRLRNWFKLGAGRIGVAVALFNLLASVSVLAHWETTFRFRPVEPWVQVADEILGFPVGTVDSYLTHRSGAILRVGGVTVDLFPWEFLLNAALWGVVASVIYRRVTAARRSQDDPVR
jgi:hypothetical protein